MNSFHDQELSAYNAIPGETILKIRVILSYKTSIIGNTKKEVTVAWGNIPFFTWQGVAITGNHEIKLWKTEEPKITLSIKCY